MRAYWGLFPERGMEVGPHVAVNPDHGSMIYCYACDQGWFYRDSPPKACDTEARRFPKMCVFFRDVQVEHRWPW